MKHLIVHVLNTGFLTLADLITHHVRCTTCKLFEYKLW